MTKHTCKTFLIRGVISLITLFFVLPVQFANAQIEYVDFDLEYRKDLIINEDYKEDIVLYQYKGQVNPIELSENPDKRTHNTKVFNTKNGEIIHRYANNTFYKEGGQWYDTEYATTTITQWEDVMLEKNLDILSYVIIPKAKAETYQISVDGGVGYWNSASSQDFATVISANGNDNSGISTTNVFTGIYSDTITNKYDGNYRGLFSFDTSDLSGETISTSSLFIYTYDIANPYSDSIWTCKGDVSSSLDNGDYERNYNPSKSNCTASTTFASLNSDAYTEFPINNPDTFINKTSSTTFLMIGDYDINLSAPTWSSGAIQKVRARFSEYSGSDYDPYLEIGLSEEQQATTTPIDYNEADLPEFLPVINDLSMITGVIYTMASGSTTTIESIQKVYYHIPFLVWLVLWLIFAFIFGRILLEFIIILRQKNGR